MFKHSNLSLFVFISVLLLAVTFSHADNTFVVTDDVVFVRDDPKKISPYENMSISQLDDEYHNHTYGEFPRYFFYGENITGTVEKENPDVVKAKITLYEWEKDKRKERKVTAYIDRKKLWHEPPLTNISTNSYMTLNNARVYLLPDIKSRAVLSVYQGEVFKVRGRLKYEGISWVKVKFGSYDSESYYEKRESSGPSRYGYIKESDLQPIETGKVDESKLTISEIPKSMRNSELIFSNEDRARLSAIGFYIESVPSYERINVDDMIDLYHAVDSSIFITSDMYLHSFHLIFDRMLQDVEEKKIFPEIKALTKKVIEETKKELRSNKEGNEKIKRALLHNLFFFSVAAKLFDPGFVVPQEVRSDVTSIVKRIVKAEGQLPSFKNKIELGEEDFTQYKVRGHYQKKNHKSELTGEIVADERLERYFRGMMWYGRYSFLLSNDTRTISAILMTRTLENSGEVKRWARINAVLTSLIGKIDDWSPEDYRRVVEKVYGNSMPKLEDVANEDKLKDFKEQAVKMLPSQKIVSVQTGVGLTQKERLEKTSGFKFLGQRFTADAYIFNQLSSPSVGTDADPRNLPAPLDVMSILGSKAAQETISKEISTHEWAEDYKSQAEKLKKEMLDEIDKKETSYSNWLYSLTAFYLPTKSKQLFAAKEPWSYKNLNTALGSWTELKHDTILYSEQSYSEQGSGESFEVPAYEPPYVKGYVEPNPEFFERLLDMVSMVRANLQKNKFITELHSTSYCTTQHFARCSII